MDWPGIDATSGFDLRQLTLFAGATGPVFEARAGYMLDLGPELETNVVRPMAATSASQQEESGNRENSDCQDAVTLGLSVQHPLMGLASSKAAARGRIHRLGERSRPWRGRNTGRRSRAP